MRRRIPVMAAARRCRVLKLAECVQQRLLAVTFDWLRLPFLRRV